MTDHPGIEHQAVTQWLTQTVASSRPPFTFELIAAGGSNLTYRVTDAAAQQWALRRPPEGRALATAHDMGREHRIISALQGSAVPVPGVVGMCEDDAVNGADLSALLSFWDSQDVRGDLNGDGVIDGADLAALLSSWGLCP